MQIVIFAGGTGAERDVSLASGSVVGTALREAGHAVTVCDPGSPELVVDLDSLSDGVPVDFPSREQLQDAHRAFRERFFSSATTELLRGTDIVFNCLHGGYGEDGRLHGYLEMLGVRHTGAPSRTCATAWDKELSKRLVSSAGVPVATSWLVKPGDNPSEHPSLATRLEPVVVKPIHGGSTHGVMLLDRGRDVFELGDRSEVLIVEEFLPGREMTVSVVQNQPLPIIEIISPRAIFDYEAKYQQGGAVEVCPADVTTAYETLVHDSAVAAAAAIGFDDTAYCRMDFRENGDGTPTFIEANSLPGLTRTSLLPRAAAAAGLPFPELCQRLIDIAP
ncbi:ATP-grasp domain-containing protein [Mycobacterium sp. AT1]|uniref:D-alanine--D-alanine ligase family protein n=1 Tax=Mycobacterium sp. AT1 TaxID=1961706 RepID=UPI0009AEF2E1|nr:ATP-grasp domain-containing protein [Mycobacterium sp. AT1]OPX05549.1 hypothetical protein B1790_31375 [Mycobacterium sp. AT1]